jgi:hypothetical protein
MKPGVPSHPLRLESHIYQRSRGGRVTMALPPNSLWLPLGRFTCSRYPGMCSTGPACRNESTGRPSSRRGVVHGARRAFLRGKPPGAAVRALAGSPEWSLPWVLREAADLQDCALTHCRRTDASDAQAHTAKKATATSPVARRSRTRSSISAGAGKAASGRLRSRDQKLLRDLWRNTFDGGDA